MPYADNKSLPDTIKNALPDAGQTIWREAFNSSFYADKDEEKAIRIAWAAVRNAGYEKQGDTWVKVSKNVSERDQVYSVWTSIKARCDNKNDKDYARYGGRGISMCDRWANSFDAFWEDMGPRPEGGTVERKDNDKGYSPGNCIWASRKEQSNNRNFEQYTAEFDAEIMAVGTWNGDTFTESDLDNMVANFSTLKDEVKPPLKLGHNAKQPLLDGKFALGWVRALRREGNKLIATFAQVPDILVKAIKSGRYKRVSSEVYFRYKNIKSKVLAAVSILGADIPAVDSLKDLDAYLSQTPDSGSFDRIGIYSLQVDEKGLIVNYNNNNGATNMDELKQYQDKNKQLEADLAKANKESADAADKLSKFIAERAKERRESDATTFKAFCEGQVKAKKMTPAARDTLVKDIEKLCYTEDKGFSVSLDVFKAFMELQKPLITTDERGGSSDNHEYADAGIELDVKTRDYMTKNKVTSYADAMTAVLESDKALAKAYLSQSTKREDTDDED